MKNAKKLLLLLLSLALLIGVFTVAALADDNAADAATVVYPDGSVETYAVGETIVSKEMTDFITDRATPSSRTMQPQVGSSLLTAWLLRIWP